MGINTGVTLQVAAKVFLQDSSGKVLLLRRSKTHPRYALQWDLPGGFLEDGEDPKSALERELHEEVGLDVSANTITLINADAQFYDNKNTGKPPLSVTRLYFTVQMDVVAPLVSVSWEHDVYQWVDLTAVFELLIGHEPFDKVAGYLKMSNILVN